MTDRWRAAFTSFMHHVKLRGLLLSSLLLAVIGCGKEGVEAFAEEVCACKDAACAAALREKYKDLPEMKLKLKEVEALPAAKQKALETAMSCSMKLQSPEDAKSEGAAPSEEPGGGSKGKPSTAGGGEKAPSLEAHTNAAMGYSIQLPKGFEATEESANSGTYGYDTMVIMVRANAVALKTSDDLLLAVNTGKGKVDKQTKGETLLAIVDAPNKPLNIYAGPKGTKMTVHVMAEPSMRKLAIEVCASLKPTKK